MALEVVLDGIGEHLGLPVLALLPVLLRCQHHSLGSVFFALLQIIFVNPKKSCIFAVTNGEKSACRKECIFFAILLTVKLRQLHRKQAGIMEIAHLYCIRITRHTTSGVYPKSLSACLIKGVEALPSGIGTNGWLHFFRTS